MTINHWNNGRNFALYDDNGELIAVFTYLKGARHVAQMLTVERARKAKKEAK